MRQRFKQEYLRQLVHRGMSKETCSLKVGDIVLIGSDNMKRVYWPMGRVVEVLPGRDGKLRLVRLKTETEEFLRPVQQCYPLEVTQEEATVLNEDLKTKNIAVREKYKSVSGTVPQPNDIITRSGRKVKVTRKYGYV